MKITLTIISYVFIFGISAILLNCEDINLKMVAILLFGLSFMIPKTITFLENYYVRK